MIMQIMNCVSISTVQEDQENINRSLSSFPQVLPKKADWIKQRAVGFDPHNNKVMTEDGQEVNYEFLVVALGLQLNYNQVGQSC